MLLDWNTSETEEMKITITSTDILTQLDGVPVRQWEGVTERGTKCIVFTYCMAVANSEDSSQFEAELKEIAMPAGMPPLNDPHESAIDLGECCACGRTENVRNVVMHNKRAPVPGTGWGCVVCSLPNDGAVSVICDLCLETNAKIKDVCHGFPKAKSRRALASLSPEPFQHDMRYHPEMDHVNMTREASERKPS